MRNVEMKDESWKPVAGYEDRYLVSNMGRVKSLWCKHGGRNGVSVVRGEHIMKPFDNGHGYKVVPLDDKVKYGVLADDNSRILISHDGSRVLYDPQNPRTKITIRFL